MLLKGRTKEMDWIEDICRQRESGQNLSNKQDEIICPRCNGTGIDPDYKEVNAILVAIDDLYQGYLPSLLGMVQVANREAPYCLKCYGMKKLDWIKYAQGTFRQEFADRKRKAREGFLRDVQPFLAYVFFGETHLKIKGRPKYLHFDRETKSWVKVDGPKDDVNTLRLAFEWLHRFHDDGCWDTEAAGDIPLNYHDIFRTRLEEHLKTIKAELLCSEELTTERFIEIKNDLDLFWYKIEKLDEIRIEDTANGKPSTEFKFTWESILRKFGLPLRHLASLNSRKSKAEK
jgi:hypothetical protein